MAAEPIHIEADDDVPAIIERIRRSTADEVHLVLPPYARFAQSRFNFQLLKQYSTRLGKRVAIWSPEPAVQRLAEESGFGAVRPQANGQPARASASAPGPGAPAAAPRMPNPGAPPPRGRPQGPVPPQGGMA